MRLHMVYVIITCETVWIQNQQMILIFCSNQGFPKGSPDGSDPLQVAHRMAEA